jgi:hypothetical protein
VFMVPRAEKALLQVPPSEVLVKTVVAPGQTELTPEIVLTVALLTCTV